MPVEPAAAGHAPEPDPRAEEDAGVQGGHLAGRPAADAEPGDGSTDEDTGEDAEEGDDPGGASSLLHVPIKRKGSRKR